MAEQANSGVTPVVWAAFLMLVPCAGLGLVCGGRAAGAAALLGGVVGATVQVAAAILLLRRKDASEVSFLGAFALGSAVRVMGGTFAILIALAVGVPAPAAFVAGFGALYVVLEVVTDIMFVRNENRSNRAG